MTKEQLLKEYFGHVQFRQGQEEIVNSLIAGRDALCVMPTGAGKSICYQVPALALPGVSLVISPLISLMKDQVTALTQAGVKAAYLNSSLTPRQHTLVLERLRAGAYKLLYVAPERLMSEGFLAAIQGLEIGMVAVDEAHCVSQWGQDFRPSYLKILEFVRALPTRPVMGAFTATATGEVKRDIEDILKLRDPLSITTGFDRPNLYFGVLAPRDKNTELLRLLLKYESESGIVYCSTRKAVEEVCALLCDRGLAATRYHAGLGDQERRQNQEDFVTDACPIMVATNAFGMGIDKSNVSFVVHYNMPKNIESYYQEAGRAGRDGSPAECTLFYSPGDVHMNRFLIDHADPNPELSQNEQALVKERDKERLKYMTFYCTTTDCLRAFILRYFGERSPLECGNCSSCEGEFQLQDITLEAQKILSCVGRTGGRFGVGMVMDVLRGSKNERLLRLQLEKQSTYGLLADTKEKLLRRMIDTLLLKKYLQQTDEEYPVLQLGERAAALLRHGEKVELRLPLEREKPQKKRKEAPGGPVDTVLYGQLKKLRATLAQKASVPAYVVFTDASLADMCRKKPQTPQAFLEVSGVGQAKLERYSAAFLQAIADYTREEASQ